MALIKLNNRSSEDNAIHGRRNLIINGDYSVNQRGVISSSATSISSNQYIIDRWWLRKSSSTSNNVSLLEDQSVTGLTSLTNVLKLENFNDSAWVGQYVEIATNKFISNQQVTVSFYAKADANLSGFSVFLHTGGGEGGDHGAPYFTQNETVTTSWQRFTYTMTVGTLANDSAGGYLTLGFGQADTDTSLYLAGVQLEVGSVATPFEHRSYGEELSLCQRYYYNHITAGSGSEALVTTATSYNSTSAYCGVRFPVTMRSIPTIRQYNATDAWQYYNNNQSDRFNSFSMFGASQSSINQAMINNGQGMSITAGQSGNFQGGNSACYLHFDAEL